VDSFVYPYSDLAGFSNIRYKWRFSAAGVNPVSPFSERVMGELEVQGILPVSIGVARFVGPDGKPTRGTILVYMPGAPETIGGVAVGGLQFSCTADAAGLVQVSLVKGATVRVAIEGSAMVREFVVPNSDSFNLLTAMTSAPDPFTVQVTVPMLTRRSL